MGRNQLCGRAIMNGQCGVAASDVVVDLHKIFSVLCTRSTTAIMGRGRPTSAMGNCTHRASHSSVLIAWHNHQFTVHHSSTLCHISQSWPRLISARERVHLLSDFYYNSTSVCDLCSRFDNLGQLFRKLEDNNRIIITQTHLWMEKHLIIYVKWSKYSY